MMKKKQLTHERDGFNFKLKTLPYTVKYFKLRPTNSISVMPLLTTPLVSNSEKLSLEL